MTGVKYTFWVMVMELRDKKPMIWGGWEEGFRRGWWGKTMGIANDDKRAGGWEERFGLGWCWWGVK
jgi:hypothetical protein